jgi:hypothetical protein
MAHNQPTMPWTRERWLQAGSQEQRIRWAAELPLPWVLEYQPTILLPGKGQIVFDPWPFQQDFMMCRDRFRAINKPRQCGISTTAAAEAAWEFDNVPGAVIVIISKDKDAAVNFHKYVRNILWSVRKNNPNAPKIIKDNETQTTNALGNTIRSLAASKESGRSFSATHLYFDELAFVQYAEEIWQAASATLAQTRGRVTAISTPKGRANLFYRIFEEKNHLGFTIFQYAWWDVPTYNPYYGEYMIAKLAGNKVEMRQWIEKAKSGDWYRHERPKYTDLAWRQEFEGAFDANLGSTFTEWQLRKVFHDNYLKQKTDEKSFFDEWYTSEPEQGKLYATGIDLGRKNDPTVIITYDYKNNPAHMVDYKYIEAGRADWQMIVRIIKEHLKAWPGMATHDGTGSGDSVTDQLYGLSEPFVFTKSGKQNIVERMQHAMDHRGIRCPKIDRLYREHQRYMWEDKDLEQDTVMANALAIQQFYDPGGSVVGFQRLSMTGNSVS